MHVELPIFAFLAAILVLVPAPWHWRARNVPTLSIMAWLCVVNLIYGINSIIWADNVLVVASVWCDIVTKIQVGANLALPACCLCLCIHLERIASSRHSGLTAAQKRNHTIFDVLMCWILPMIYMATHYVVQGHRFDIFEHFGCRAAIYTSLPSVFLIWLPPFLAVGLTFVFGSLALHHFFHHRLTFARFLQNSNSAMTPSRYLRLVAMAITQMMWGATVLSITAWATFRVGMQPWVSWEFVHAGFSQVGQFPMILFPKYVVVIYFLNWWFLPISAFIFFIFFAFGEEAVKSYQARIRSVTERFSKPSETDIKPGKRAAFASSPSVKALKISYPKPPPLVDSWTTDGSVSPSKTSMSDTTFVNDDRDEIEKKTSQLHV